jgi:hypothetical protein
MPVRHARSETRGRPPCGRCGAIGKNGSTRSHNGSGSSAAAILLRLLRGRAGCWRFCYTLLGVAAKRGPVPSISTILTAHVAMAFFALEFRKPTKWSGPTPL